MVARITVLTVFFAAGRAKILVFAQVSACCKMSFQKYMEHIKTPYFTMFLLPHYRKKSPKMAQKRALWRLCQAIVTHLDRSWSYVSPSWSYVGPSWSYVGPSWSYVGPSWGNVVCPSGPRCFSPATFHRSCAGGKPAARTSRQVGTWQRPNMGPNRWANIAPRWANIAQDGPT